MLLPTYSFTVIDGQCSIRGIFPHKMVSRAKGSSADVMGICKKLGIAFREITWPLAALKLHMNCLYTSLYCLLSNDVMQSSGKYPLTSHRTSSMDNDVVTSSTAGLNWQSSTEDNRAPCYTSREFGQYLHHRSSQNGLGTTETQSLPKWIVFSVWKNWDTVVESVT